MGVLGADRPYGRGRGRGGRGSGARGGGAPRGAGPLGVQGARGRGGRGQGNLRYIPKSHVNEQGKTVCSDCHRQYQTRQTFLR